MLKQFKASKIFAKSLYCIHYKCHLSNNCKSTTVYLCAIVVEFIANSLWQKWHVLPRLNQLIGSDKDRPSGFQCEPRDVLHEQNMNILVAVEIVWILVEVKSIYGTQWDFRAFLPILSSSFGASELPPSLCRRMETQGKLYVYLVPHYHHSIPYTYLKDCCWTPLHQKFLHTPCTKVKVVLEQKKYMNEKRLKCSSTT